MSHQTKKNIKEVVLDMLMRTGWLELFADNEFVDDDDPDLAVVVHRPNVTIAERTVTFDGEPYTLIESEDNRVRSWAHDIIDSHRVESTRLDAAAFGG